MVSDYTEPIGQRYSTLCLANLCSHPDNHEIILQKGGLKLLLQLAHTADTATRQVAVIALANLCSNSSHYSLLGREGVLPMMVALAHSNDPNMTSLALSAMRRLASYKPNQIALLQLGVLDALLAASHPYHPVAPDIHRDLAALLFYLSIPESSKHTIASHAVLPPLIYITLSKDTIVAKFACAAIGNIAEDPSTHRRIVDHNGMIHLLQLTVDANALVVYRESSRALANLSTTLENHQYLIENGVQAFASLGLVNDSECQLHAAKILRQMAANSASHDNMIEQNTMPTLFSLLKSPELETQMQAILCIRDMASNSRHR